MNEDLINRITYHLSSGGLFNPELADHLAVRGLLMECREALAQQAEPVAWRNAAIRVGEDLCSVGPFGYYDMTAEQWLEWALSVVTVHASPPPRQPLTDEMREQMRFLGFDTLESRTPFVAGWIKAEAAHGIKGQA